MPQIIGCRASINGKVEIKNSEVVDTFLGALTLTSLAQLTLFKGARLIFNNNTGRYMMLAVLHAKVILLHTLSLFLPIV